MLTSRLPKRVYSLPTLELARRLLGCTLVTNIGGIRTAGRIVETEAYHGDTDPACHCYYRRTPRNEVMFEKAGSLYVYQIYGMHHCVNLVSEQMNTGAAVLIRALEPTDGISTMVHRRPTTREKDLANGPAKLCQALRINTSLSGHHVSTSQRIWIEPAKSVADSRIVATTRIGISKATELPWRFYVADSPCVSKPARIG